MYKLEDVIRLAKEEADRAYRKSWEIAQHEADSDGAEFRAGAQAGRSIALQQIISKLEDI